MRNGRDKTACAVSVLHLGSPTGLYGAERWILAILRYLDPTIVRSVVAVIQDNELADQVPLCDAAAGMGIETTEFHSPGRLSFSAIGQIRRFIKENAIGIVHSHGYKTDIIGMLAARGTDCRVVSTPHGWSVANEGLMLTLYEILDRISFLFMDAVVPLSPELYKGLVRWPFMRKKLRFIRNGVDLQELDAELSNQARANLGRKDTNFSIGYIGRLTPLKCVDVLIRAFSQLKGGGSQLIVVGEGPSKPQLEQLASAVGVRDAIDFTGFREDRLALMSNWDVFVLPSSSEGIPRCLMEAMAAGKAVIATDIPGCRELVNHGETGMLFQPGDSETLTILLQSLADDPAFRKKLAKQGQEFVREEYSAERMALEYTSLYQSLTG